MDYAEAASICEGAMTALPYLRDHGNIQSGHRVLIYGASGAVGTFAVQLAKHFGAEVTGVCSTANVELVKSLGADRVIDYTKEDFTASGERFDIVFDTVGKSSFSVCKKALTPEGVYLSTEFQLPLLFQMFWTSIFGGKRAKFTATGLRPAPDKITDMLLLKEWVEAGKLRPASDRRYPLEEAAEASRYVDTGRKKGNVVLTMNHGGE